MTVIELVLCLRAQFTAARCAQFICHPFFVSLALFAVNRNEHAKPSASETRRTEWLEQHHKVVTFLSDGRRTKCSPVRLRCGGARARSSCRFAKTRPRRRASLLRQVPGSNRRGSSHARVIRAPVWAIRASPIICGLAPCILL